MAAASSASGENENEKPEEEEEEAKPPPPPPAHFVCEGVVWKQHIKESDVDRNPVERSQSTITYVAYLDDGDETSVGDRPFKDSSNATMFDERHRDEPITFELYPEPQENGTRYFGVEQTKCPLPILADAIKTMRPGEKATFTVKPEQAFGEEGDDELGVPPNATVKYDIFQHDFNTVELVDHDKEFLKMIIKKEDEKELTFHPRINIKHGKGRTTTKKKTSPKRSGDKKKSQCQKCLEGSLESATELLEKDLRIEEENEDQDISGPLLEAGDTYMYATLAAQPQ